ncbi:MAG: class I SAM-dependent methyltransferase [Saprospiraceae bacterium]
MDIYDPVFVRKLFDRMSDSYDRMNTITSFGFSVLWRKQFINKVTGTKDPIEILDLLSGLGENWDLLLKKFPNGHITALDFSSNMVDQSADKNRKYFSNKVEILNQNILQNELRKQHYDVITCAFGLKTFNAEQIDTIADCVENVLKDDGAFTFIEISKPNFVLLQFFYRFYLKWIIPMLGKLFLGNPEDYRMLWTYTDRFENCSQVKQIFERNNLEVEYHTYFFGCASGISGRKVK